jgi:hypothetical protein
MEAQATAKIPRHMCQIADIRRHNRLGPIALNLLKTEKTLEIGISGKRKCCGWDDPYLPEVIGQ